MYKFEVELLKRILLSEENISVKFVCNNDIVSRDIM